jgi:hypothetical protein
MQPVVYTPSALNVKGLQAINEKLQCALDAARMEAEVARRRSSHSKVCETEEERSWHLRILKNIKLSLWPIEVFINKDKKLIRATTLIMLEMNPPEVAAYRDEGDRKVAQAKWVNDNTEVVRKMYNNQRNYVQGQIRDLMVKALYDGKTVPNTKQVQKIVERNESFLKTEEGREMFDFYWDHLLMKVGGRENWNQHIRHHKTISAAYHPRTPGGRVFECMSSKLEAFVLVVFENCYKKWEYIAEEKKTNGWNHVCDDKHEKMQTLYTSSKGGQQQWGGWTKEGRDVFKAYADANKAARKTKASKRAEQACLTRLRIHHKLEGPDKKEPKKKKRKHAPLDDDESDGDDLMVKWNPDDDDDDDGATDDDDQTEDEGMNEEEASRKPPAKKNKKTGGTN